MSTEKPPKNPLALEATNAIQDADQLADGQEVYLKNKTGVVRRGIVSIDYDKPYVSRTITIADDKGVIWSGVRCELHAQIKEESLVLLQQNPEAVASIQGLISGAFDVFAENELNPGGAEQPRMPALLMASGGILHRVETSNTIIYGNQVGLCFFWRQPDGGFERVNAEAKGMAKGNNISRYTISTQSGEILVLKVPFEDIRHHLYYLNLNEIGSATQLITNATRAQAENNNALSSPSS